MRRKRTLPIPEAITPGRWTINTDMRARVDLPSRALYIPTSDDAPSACVRAHELAHIRFSPKRPPALKGIDPFTIQALEDYRVNKKAEMMGVSFASGFPQWQVDHALRSALDSGSAKLITLLLIACGIPAWQSDTCRAAILDKNPAFDPCMRLAVRTTALLERNRAPTSFGRATPALSFPRLKQVARWLEAQFPSLQDNVEGQDGETDTPSGKRTGQALSSRLSAPWGTATIETPMLIRPKRTRGARHSDSGTLLSAIHRLPVDQRVFRQQLRAPRRGSVLIDASGSMSLTQGDIEALAKAIPTGIIAAYAGNGTTGVIRILARHGKVAAPGDAYDLPGGNIVDGPALQWLGTQSLPRYWICDGIVTGIHDHTHPTCDAEASALQAHHRIVRLDSLATAHKTLIRSVR